MTSPDPLDAMRGAQQALIAALDSHDIVALEAAVESCRASLGMLRDGVAVSATADARARAAELLRQSDAAQMRVNFLTDALQRRLGRLAQAGGRGRVALYAREGR